MIKYESHKDLAEAFILFVAVSSDYLQQVSTQLF